MTKIALDIVLIILFTVIAGLQVYVIYKIKKLKKYYKQFNRSEQNFVKSIEKARQSLMLVNSQATDIMPELKLSIDKAESVIQDFSFIMARANRKIDQLQNAASDSPATVVEANEKSILKNMAQENYSPNLKSKDNNTNNMDFLSSSKEEIKENEDPLMSRLAKLEQEEEISRNKNKHQVPKLSTQEELIEKALKEIL